MHDFTVRVYGGHVRYVHVHTAVKQHTRAKVRVIICSRNFGKYNINYTVSSWILVDYFFSRLFRDRRST